MTIREVFERLGTGERWWAAELLLRLVGLALLATAALAFWWLNVSLHQPPPHEAQALELLDAAAGVLACCLGATLAVLGPSPFEQVPVPHGSVILVIWTGDGRDE